MAMLRLCLWAALLVATWAAPLPAPTEKTAAEKSELLRARDKFLTMWCENAQHVGTFPCISNAITKRVRATKDPVEKKKVRMH